MSQTKADILAILDAADSRPKRRFGQNFMIDRNLVAAVAAAGEVSPGDVVIEVGPGTGTLTEELLARVGPEGEVLAVEIDRDLVEVLWRRFGGAVWDGEMWDEVPTADPNDTADPTFYVLEGDALAGKHALHPVLADVVKYRLAVGRRVKLVANLPYNIASPLVVELLAAGVSTLAFTVQKEVADRMRAAAGGDAYGPLTVVVQLLAEVEVLRNLPPTAFWPAPKIDSTLVRLRRRDLVSPRDLGEVGAFVRRLFSMRRKTLRRAMREIAGDAGGSAVTSLSLDPQARPETLTPGQVLSLFDALRVLPASVSPVPPSPPSDPTA